MSERKASHPAKSSDTVRRLPLSPPHSSILPNGKAPHTLVAGLSLCIERHDSVSVGRLGQYHLSLVSAAPEGIRQIFGCVRASACGALEFTRAPGPLVGEVLEVRTLLPAL